MKALRNARSYAPGFVVSCGILPEISESASERLHSIVRDVAERHLDGRRHMTLLKTSLRRATDSAEASDRRERHLTEVIASEVTASYLFGLAVGLAIRDLPERLNGRR